MGKIAEYFESSDKGHEKLIHIRTYSRHSLKTLESKDANRDCRNKKDAIAFNVMHSAHIGISIRSVFVLRESGYLPTVE